MVLTEVLRSVIHARRKSQDGLGGTQDIAMWGMIICWVLFIFDQMILSAWIRDSTEFNW
jgi:hypothetical protein